MKRVALGLILAVLAGCAALSPKPVPTPPAFVAVFFFVAHCNRDFVEAAFVRADGTIVETGDIDQAKVWDEGIPKERGRIVPMFVTECGVGL